MSRIICPHCGKVGMNTDHTKRCIGKAPETNMDKPQAQIAPEFVAKAGKKSLKSNPVPSKHKYHAQKTEVDGIMFPSKKQAERYKELKLLEKTGEIGDLQLEVPFVLAPSVVINGRKRPPLRYFADFVYREVPSGNQVCEDSKGMRTEGYRIKRHLMAILGYQIRET